MKFHEIKIHLKSFEIIQQNTKKITDNFQIKSKKGKKVLH